MQKPNLNQMWETFIQIPNNNNQVNLTVLYNKIRFEINPLVKSLIESNKIYWYSFLIHNKGSGVPTSQEDNNPYFHIRIASEKSDIDFTKELPKYCVMTRKIDPNWVREITIDDKGTKFNTSLLKNEQIEEIWKIIGEQSEWLLSIFSIYKDNVEIPIQYIIEFFHYYFNAIVLFSRINCPKCGCEISL